MVNTTYEVWVSNLIHSNNTESEPYYSVRWGVEGSLEEAEALVDELLKTWREVVIEKVTTERVSSRTSKELQYPKDSQDLSSYKYSYKDHPIK